MTRRIDRLRRPLGVLALQGDFAAHGRALDKIGQPWQEVRYAKEIEGVSGLIMPGGESTTVAKLMTGGPFAQAIVSRAKAGMPLYGSCAGAIMLATEISGDSLPSLRLADISIERNAYGRQIDSFIAQSPCPLFGPPDLEMVFIRAPIVRRAGPIVEVLASWGGHPVFLRQDNILITTFHPELSADTRIHELFARLALESEGMPAPSQAAAS
jgi:5'-phosphate synthase pdxT subunit